MTSAAVALAVCHPLDTAMVRLQRLDRVRMNLHDWNSLSRCLRQVLQSPYAGFAPHALLYCANGAIRFGAFDLARAKLLAHSCGGGGHRLHVCTQPAWQLFVSGAFAGCLASLLLHPLMVLKVVLQAGHGDAGIAGVFAARNVARRLLATEGISGLYRALPTGLLFSGVQMGTYFTVYRSLQRSDLRAAWSAESRPLLWNAAAGGTAGALCWVAAMPLAAALARQAGAAPGNRVEKSLVAALIALCQEQGWRGCYRGIFPAMVRAVPVNAVLLPLSDHVREVLDECLP